MMKSKKGVPKFLTYLVLQMMGGSLKDKCKFDVLSIKPIDKIDTLQVPTMFILGEKDDMVLKERFQKMFENCKANRKRILIERDAGHPDGRSENCIEHAFDFMGVNIRGPQNEELDESDQMEDPLKMTIKDKNHMLRPLNPILDEQFEKELEEELNKGY
jgi:hypothetical protein